MTFIGSQSLLAVDAFIFSGLLNKKEIVGRSAGNELRSLTRHYNILQHRTPQVGRCRQGSRLHVIQLEVLNIFYFLAVTVFGRNFHHIPSLLEFGMLNVEF